MSSSGENNAPLHVAIIMDGNGRWATRRGLPRIMGHKKGVERVREIVRAAPGLGITTLTLYAFSSENWRRPADEVSGLMGLLKSFLTRELDELCANGVRLAVIGETERLPADVREVLDAAITRTSGNRRLNLNLALSYGGRGEIVHAARRIAARCLNGEIAPDDIGEELFSAHLHTAGQPDPDLLIRTGGEQRLSNFLLWQLSYAELCFVPAPWPEFDAGELERALADFRKRERRFGMTSEQIRNRTGSR